MVKHRIALMLALAGVFFAQGAQAFFDPPYITPENPIAGDTVSVNIHGGQCDAIIEETGYPQITRAGDAIRLVVFGILDSYFCNYGVGTATFELGVYPAGAYTLQFDLLHSNWPFPDYSPETLGVVTFVVAPAATRSIPVPIDSRLALTILIFILLGFAASKLRRGRPRFAFATHTPVLFERRAATPTQDPYQ